MKTDNDLVKEFQLTQNEECFAQLVRRHSSFAFQLAYGTLHNREDAEEVVQDAFLRIHRSLPKFRGDSQFSTWMYRIIINLCNNRFRWNSRRNIRQDISIDAPIDSSTPELHLEVPSRALSPYRKLEIDEMRHRLDAAMKALPDVYRTAVLLRNVRQMEYDDIASILGCAVGTVKSRINRGRELLREALKAE